MRIIDHHSALPVDFELHSGTNRAGQRTHTLTITHLLEPENNSRNARVNRVHFQMSDNDCALLFDWFRKEEAKQFNPALSITQRNFLEEMRDRFRGRVADAGDAGANTVHVQDFKRDAHTIDAILNSQDPH